MRWVILVLVGCLNSLAASGQLSQTGVQPSDSLTESTDSLKRMEDSTWNLLVREVMSSDSATQKYFSPYRPAESAVHESTNADWAPPIGAIDVRESNNHLLVFIVFLNLAFLVSIIRLANGRNLRIFLRSLYDNPLAFRILSEQKTLFTPVNMQLLLIATGMLALGVFVNIEVSGNDFLSAHPSVLFLCIFSALISIYLLKFLLHYLMELVFEVKRGGLIISNHTIGSLFLFAVVFFPIYLIHYLNGGWLSSRDLGLVMGALLVLCLVYRILRTAYLINLYFPYPRVYLFLYLCGFEIVPWLILFKVGDTQ